MIGRTSYMEWAILGAAAVLALVAFMAFFVQIPLEETGFALDWPDLWETVEGGTVSYPERAGFRSPPWAIWMLVPFGLLPMRPAWGALVFVTVVAMIFIVPRVRPAWRHWLGVLLLISSYPSPRNIADGNLEGLVLLGLIVFFYGFRRQKPYVTALGALMAAIKVQEVLLLMAAAALYMMRSWPRREWIKAAAAVVGVVALSMLWIGREWLHILIGDTYDAYAGNLNDMSLIAALQRTGIVPGFIIALAWLALLAATVYLVWISAPTLPREKAGLLIASSLLLAPYAGGNSLLALVAVGMVPLFQTRPRLGALLILLVDLAYLMPRDVLFYGQSYWWTAIAGVTWAMMAWFVWQEREAPVVDPDKSS